MHPPPVLRRLSFLALIVVAGCITAGRAPGEEGDENEVRIRVRNDSFNQATVYLSENYGARRLGIVRGKSEATFRLTWHLPEIQLRIKFLAGGEIHSQPWSVGSGEVWRFVIPASCC